MKALFFLFIFLPTFLFSQEIEVRLIVSADETVENRALSKLSRLLREFEGLTLSDDYFSDYKIATKSVNLDF
jgi:hypothetical protein